MVSWSDSESTEGSAAQYISSDDSPVKIPATIDEPSFEGLADDLNVICEHGNLGRKYVAFEGISTGRRFIACATEAVANCGLVQWVDEHWPEHLQNAIHKLCLMYEDSQHNNMMACLEHSCTIHNLTQQKKELQKTYEKLVEDVNNLLDYKDSQPEVNQKNDAENISVSVESSMTKDAEIKKLKAVVDQLKQIHVAQATVIRNLKFNHLKEKEKLSSDKRTLEICYADLKKKKDDLKKEKDKLDCCIAELMKLKEKLIMEKSTLASCIVELKTAGDSNKRKLNQIKAICDED
ncbi:kinesin-related protein 1-like [Triticum urartu]|uniref:kinesin-related protein 1-like n=1 Tax=Triticum urartu TaxID=4572 RepID=UPI00204490B5|nr:kinesin-related protein 1-like [Triticum urartu]